jgi:hypothetical protein
MVSQSELTSHTLEYTSRPLASLKLPVVLVAMIIYYRSDLSEEM